MVRRRSWVALSATGFVLAVVGACSSDDGAATPAPAQAEIGPDGGTISFDGITVTVPPGALTKSVAISVSTEGAVSTGRATPLGKVYRFAPQGLRFRAPVTVTFPDPGDANGRTAGVFWSSPDGKAFGRPSAFVRGGGKIAVKVRHFSDGFVGTAPPAGYAAEPAGPALPPSLAHAVGDFDGDGTLDFAFARAGAAPGTIDFSLAKGGAAPETPMTSAPGTAVGGMASVPVERGADDVVGDAIVAYLSGGLVNYVSKEGTTFSAVMSPKVAVDVDLASAPVMEMQSVAGALDGLVVTSEGNVFWLSGKAEPGAAPTATTVPSVSSATGGALGGDEVAPGTGVVFDKDSLHVIEKGQVTATVPSLGPKATGTVGDLDHDGKADVFEVDPDSGRWAWHLGANGYATSGSGLLPNTRMTRLGWPGLVGGAVIDDDDTVVAVPFGGGDLKPGADLYGFKSISGQAVLKRRLTIDAGFDPTPTAKPPKAEAHDMNGDGTPDVKVLFDGKVIIVRGRIIDTPWDTATGDTGQPDAGACGGARATCQIVGSDTGCCANLRCNQPVDANTGTCCFANGKGTCQQPADCCNADGDCMSGTCCAKTSVGCTAAAECCTGHCEVVAQAPTASCCAPRGASCVAPNGASPGLACCGDDVCQNGTCACLAAGADCSSTYPQQCCSKACNAGKCQ